MFIFGAFLQTATRGWLFHEVVVASPKSLRKKVKKSSRRWLAAPQTAAMSSRVRVYMACSMDGFIAGPDNDLDWLQADHTAPGDLKPDPEALGFEDFMAQVGAMLMGRTTYDVVEGFGAWPYGDTPVVVATRRSLNPVSPTIETAAGDIKQLIDRARSLAQGKDIYLDGGTLIRQALDEALVDELTITMVPLLLGDGIRLFDGLTTRSSLQFVSHRMYVGGMLQLTLRPRPKEGDAG